MRITSLVKFVLTTAVIVFGIQLFHQGRARHIEHDRFAFLMKAPSIMPLGTTFPDAPLVGVSGAQSALPLLKGSWSLVIVAANYHREHLNYPAVLAEAYSDRRLRVYKFLAPTAANGASVRSAGGDSEPFILALDVKRAISRRLELPEDGTDYVWTLLLDSEARVAFSYPSVISPDDLRQLTQAHLGIPDRIRPDPNSGFAAGSQMPAVQLVRVAEPDKAVALADLVGGGGAVIFFRANCSSCGVGSLVSKLAALVAAGVDFRAERLIPVFSHTFDLNALRAAMKDKALPPLFVSKMLVPEWEDPYWTRADSFTAPTVVTVNSESRLAGTRNFYPWVAERLSGGTSMKGSNLVEWTAVDAASNLRFGWVRGVSALPDGGFAILDGYNHRVVMFDHSCPN